MHCEQREYKLHRLLCKTMPFVFCVFCVFCVLCARTANTKNPSSLDFFARPNRAPRSSCASTNLSRSGSASSSCMFHFSQLFVFCAFCVFCVFAVFSVRAQGWHLLVVRIALAGTVLLADPFLPVVHAAQLFAKIHFPQPHSFGCSLNQWLSFNSSDSFRESLD